MLVLHAEHGGGNNSTFTMRVTSSSETDIYSSVTSAIGSLKGPLHGGANVRVLEMMEDMKTHVKDWTSEKEIEEHLLKILNRKARELAIEKGRLEEFELYALVEKLTPGVLSKFKGEKFTKVVCINVD